MQRSFSDVSEGHLSTRPNSLMYPARATRSRKHLIINIIRARSIKDPFIFLESFENISMASHTSGLREARLIHPSPTQKSRGEQLKKSGLFYQAIGVILIFFGIIL